MNSIDLTILSAWGNEELIAPFFLKHYFDIGATKIVIFLDSTSNDKTLDILLEHPEYKNNNIIINKVSYPLGFCDEMKIDYINNFYKTLQNGWVICCDADEFVFTKEYLYKEVTLDKTLVEYESKNLGILGCSMSHPFRNILDTDLDINSKEKIILQRRYGLEYSPSTEKIPISKQAYKKPMVVKTNLNIHWSPGHHVLYGETEEQRISPSIYLEGVHWKYADPIIALYSATNKVGNYKYIARNISRGMAHNWVETPQEALQKCKDNINAEKLF